MDLEKIKLEPQISLKEMQKIMTDTLVVIHNICKKYNLQYWLMYGSLLGAVRHDGFIPWDDDIDIMMPRKDFVKFLEVAQKELGNDYFLQTPNTDRYYNILHVPVKVRNNTSTLIEEIGKKYHQGAFVDIFAMDYMGDDPEQYMKLKKRTSVLASYKMKIDFKQLSGIKKWIRIMGQLSFKLIPTSFIFNYLQKQTLKVINNNPKSKYASTGLEFLDRNIYLMEDIFPLKKHKFEGNEFYVPKNPDALLQKWYGNYMQLPPEEKRVPHGIFYSNRRYY